MGNKERAKQKGFSIGELLMVMVILALLGSIGTPAFLAARENAQKNKDISNLNTIRTALQIYYTDRGEYPKSIYACVTGYSGSLDQSKTPPPDRNIQYGLYPRRINTKETFKSEKQNDKVPLEKEDTTLVVARYPKKPKIRGVIQCFDPQSGFVNVDFVLGKDPLPTSYDNPKATKYYKFSLYDVADVSRLYPNRKKNEYELRYTRFWTRWGLGEGNQDDDTRQLGYAYPPEETVVTWNSYYRKYSGNDVTDSSKDLVLFLSGSVKQISSQTVIDKVWTTSPSDK